MNISANLLLSRKADAINRKGAHTPPLERNMDHMKKILVLEDEPSIRSFVVINLRRSGYEPIEAATGEEALEKLKQNPDTLVALLDVMLPDIDGFEVCRRIRATGSKMGILMLSAKSQEMDKITGLMTGADDYVTKPFLPCRTDRARGRALPPHRRQREHGGRALERAVRAAPALAHARQKQRAHPPDADGVRHHEAVHGKPRPRTRARTFCTPSGARTTTARSRSSM